MRIKQPFCGILMSILLSACGGGSNDVRTKELPGPSQEPTSPIDESIDQEACRIPEIPPLVDSAFSIVIDDNTVATDEPVNFSIAAPAGIDLSDYQVDWFVDAPDDSQANIVGTEGSYAYDYPGRFRIVATITHNNDLTDSEKLIDYVNVHRPYHQTIYTESRFAPQGAAQIGTPGSGEWCHYEYDVYYGKYYELWVQKDHGDLPDSGILLESLAQGDYIHDVFSEMFGWDLRTDNGAQKIVICNDVTGAGGGSGGMFVGNIPLNPDTGSSSADFWLTLIHEFIHQWDFRGGIHMSGPESAHALTSSQEYLAYTYADTPRLIQRDRFAAVTPAFNDTHIERVMYHRYLNDDSFDWGTLYNDEMMNMEYGTHPLPENKEYMQIMGGVLMAFYRMHGAKGLRAYYQQIDVLLLENPDWNRGIGTIDLSNAQRTENMLLAMSRAVGFDVSDYFDYWKFPVSQSMRLQLSQYPKSPMILDNDNDGFSRLAGDVNDCDPAIYPDSSETIDGKDNNGNGLVDEKIIDENLQGDISDITSQLPLFVKGNISDLADVDTYRFTVPRGQRAVITTFTLSAHSRTALSNTGSNAGRPNKLFSGSYTIDGHGRRGTIYDWSHLPTMNFIIDGDGTEKTIRVDANAVDGMTPNPGEYELQILISDGDNKSLSSDALIQDLYNGDTNTETATKVFLLAGQSNMEGNIDENLFNQLLTEAAETHGDRQTTLVELLRDWYLVNDDGYASYGYSDQMAALQAQEMIRFYDQGTIGPQFFSPKENVYCTFNSSLPKALQVGCGRPFGPELMLGHEAARVTAKPISLIKVAHGGTTLHEDWRSARAVTESGGVEGPNFKELIRRIDSLYNEPSSVLEECVAASCEWNAFIWFQGENDTFIDQGADYEQNLRLLLSDIRHRISPGLPIVIVQIGEWARTAGDQGQAVFDAQAAVANTLSNTALVTTNDLSGFFHYDPVAQLIIGYRVAEALKSLNAL